MERPSTEQVRQKPKEGDYLKEKARYKMVLVVFAVAIFPLYSIKGNTSLLNVLTLYILSTK